MQSKTSDPTTADHLRLAANRVAAVAQVHRNFYSNEAADISCIDFLRRLCADLSNILQNKIDVDGDQGTVPSTKIQPIGLLVNELVTNAAKHAAGRIDVEYRIKGTIHELTVCDEGEGLPSDFDAMASAGLGMKVITALTKQLGGHLTATRKPSGSGSCFRITFDVSGENV